MPKLSRLATLSVIVAVLALVILFAGPAACNRIRSLTAQARVDEAQHGALKNSAADAINTVSDVATNQAAGVEIGRRNEEEIRNAKGADARVDPDVNAAGLRALCRRASHRNDPACRMQQPHP